LTDCDEGKAALWARRQRLVPVDEGKGASGLP